MKRGRRWIQGNTNNLVGPEIFDRCVGGGKPKGSATAANIPADPKTLCFVRRSWTRPLKTINYAVNRLENDGSGMIFLSNEIIRAFVVDRKLVEREEGEEERERERKKSRGLVYRYASCCAT